MITSIASFLRLARFFGGLISAIAESLRLRDPAPARFHFQAWASRKVEFQTPQFTGELSGATADALAERVGVRE